MDNSMKKQTVSLCMIVKNEERFLEDCLKSVADVADQIVIVDTGSLDSTPDIARKYNAEIYNFKWVDDFSAARNESIRHATGDWILWMDADERLDPESKTHLKSLLKPESGPVLYKVQIYNQMRQKDNIHISSAHRLFNNHKGIEFSGRIHEQISPSAAKLGGEERNSDIIFHHLGYGLESEAQDKKNRRNLKLLLKYVGENPRHAYAHYTLAQHYALTEQHENAVKHFRIALNLNQFDKEMTASLLNAMADSLLEMGMFEAAERAALDSLDRVSDQVGAGFVLFKSAERQQNYSLALRRLEKLRKINAEMAGKIKSIATDIIIEEKVLRFSEFILLARAGELEKALNLGEELRKTDRENLTLLDNLSTIYLQRNEFAKAEQCLLHMQSLLPHELRVLDLLALAQIKQQKFSEAIPAYEEMLRLSPDNEKIIKRLAGLYAKIGQVARAEEMLTRGRTSFVN